MTSGTPLPGPDLARLVGLRLCHDLGGLAGTVGNALDMLDTVGAEAAALAADAASGLRRRLLLWRAILGGQEGATLGSLLPLLEGQLAGGRATADASAMDPAAPVPTEFVPVLLSALVVAGEALPRGGVVRLAGHPAREVVVLPDGPRAAWAPAVIRAVAGAPPAGEPTGREAVALWLAASAAAAGIRLGLALPPGAGAGPLVLTLPG